MIKRKRLIGSICCGIASVVCSIGAMPFFKNNPIVSADTVTINPNEGNIPKYGSLNDYMLYNPFAPFTLYVSSYDSYPTNSVDPDINPFEYPLYSFSFPTSYGTYPFPHAGSWYSSVYTNGYIVSADFDNQICEFRLETEGRASGNAESYTYSLEAYSTAIWLEPLDYVTLVCDTALTADFTAQIYNPDTGEYVLVQRSGRDYDPVWQPVDNDDIMQHGNLGDYLGYIVDSLDFNPRIGNTDCIVVQSLQIRYYAPTDTSLLYIRGDNHQDYTAMDYYVRSKLAMYNPINYEVPPDNIFTWIVEAVSSFLAVEILPNFSFGDLILLALGVMIFGLGLKIAFGG